jgi:hypothetical protein
VACGFGDISVGDTSKHIFVVLQGHCANPLMDDVEVESSSELQLLATLQAICYFIYDGCISSFFCFHLNIHRN